MIDLTRVRNVLEEATDLLDALDGIELDETQAVATQTKSHAHREGSALTELADVGNAF
ncbi:hypothetical protein GCM10009844_31100 [Nocardioides koreensis]|uniref:Uncharacterized protein n=1 Tax=Nocardioides koreensis TaxID=433651 RepID=A0ABN2ZZ13_9ACTN